MKQRARSFVRRYPLSLREIIATPMVFRENVSGFGDLPFPRVQIIRDLASFAGYRDGALRTALSRARGAGEVRSEVDSRGVVRFRLTETQRDMGDVVRAFTARPEGFLVCVFSFRAREEAERRAVRESLRYFGFKRIAQNTYINGIIDTSGLEAAMERAGVAERLFVFRCPSIDDPALLRRLSGLFDVEGRARELERLRRDLEAFLEEPGIDGMEFGRRVFYAGPVHHRTCFVEEPPIPSRILPEDYPLAATASLLGQAIASRREDLMGYYRTLCD